MMEPMVLAAKPAVLVGLGPGSPGGPVGPVAPVAPVGPTPPGRGRASDPRDGAQGELDLFPFRVDNMA